MLGAPAVFMGSRPLVAQDSGWLTAGTLGQQPGTLTSPQTWSNPGNAQVYDDDNPATRGTTSANSYRLVWRNFDLGSLIPAGALVDGFEVRIRRSRSNGGIWCEDLEVGLTTDSGATRTGSNKAAAGQWPTSYGEIVYGGAADLWGSGLARAGITGAGFGFVLAISHGNSQTANVDGGQLKVHFRA